MIPVAAVVVTFIVFLLMVLGGLFSYATSKNPQGSMVGFACGLVTGLGAMGLILNLVLILWVGAA